MTAGRRTRELSKSFLSFPIPFLQKREKEKEKGEKKIKITKHTMGMER